MNTLPQLPEPLACPPYVKGESFHGEMIELDAPRYCKTQKDVLLALNANRDFTVTDGRWITLRANRKELWERGYFQLNISYRGGRFDIVAGPKSARYSPEARAAVASTSAPGNSSPMSEDDPEYFGFFEPSYGREQAEAQAAETNQESRDDQQAELPKEDPSESSVTVSAFDLDDNEFFGNQLDGACGPAEYLSGKSAVNATTKSRSYSANKVVPLAASRPPRRKPAT